MIAKTAGEPNIASLLSLCASPYGLNRVPRVFARGLDRLIDGRTASASRERPKAMSSEASRDIR